MIERVTHVPIVVSDQGKALEFYTNVLGFEKRADYQLPGNPRWLTVAPRGTDVEFILYRGRSKVDLHVGPEAGTGGYHYAFLTEDCRGDYERLKARGVDFHVGDYTEPQKQYWGWNAAFRDPDGNQFVLVQPNGSEDPPVGAENEGAGSETMFGRVTHVPILVSDQDRALQFYTEELGFAKIQDSQQRGRPRWLTVAIKSQDIEFILVKGDYIVDPRPPSGKEHGGNHWVFRTNDCRKDVETLRARGVKFQDPAPVEATFGLAAYFADPDGNRLTLLEPSRAPPRKG